MSAAVTAFAPGRVELLGNHTDYNEGVVLAAALDRGVTLRGERRSDGRIALRSRHFDRRVEVFVSDFAPLRDDAWANYPLGVVHQFQQLGISIDGFEAEIDTDLALGAGVSSSAALEVATACFLLKLHRRKMPPLALAKLCQRAENEFVGVRSGLLDQVTSVFGRANQVVHLDCRSEEIRTIPFPADLVFIITDSGAKHQLIAGEYNQRREQCSAAAQALGVPALRDVSPRQLAAERDRLDPVVARRAAHVVGENERVTQAAQLLVRGDAAGFGELMNASHASSRENFENSTPELDLLVEIATGLPGVLGARLTGGGFGGSTITLAEARHAPEIAEKLAAEYRARTGHPPQPLICRPGDGAGMREPECFNDDERVQPPPRPST